MPTVILSEPVENPDQQLWLLERRSDSSYYLRPKVAELYLDLRDPSKRPGTKLTLCEKSDAFSQNWRINTAN
jgi:hypothetical protein